MTIFLYIWVLKGPSGTDSGNIDEPVIKGALWVACFWAHLHLLTNKWHVQPHFIPWYNLASSLWSWTTSGPVSFIWMGAFLKFGWLRKQDENTGRERNFKKVTMSSTTYWWPRREMSVIWWPTQWILNACTRANWLLSLRKKSIYCSNFGKGQYKV